MVETGLVEPYRGTTLHQLMGLIQCAVGRQGYVALGRQHDFDLDATADGLCQRTGDGGNERKVRVDDVEARAAVKAAYEYVGPVYLRFGRLAIPVINDPDTYQFELGKGVELRDGKDVTIIATGLPVSESLEAAKQLAESGIDAQVINIHTIKPLDEEIILAAAKKTGRIFTVEEHSVIGGLGSAAAEVLADNGCSVKLTRIGMQDVFGESGPAKELLHKYKLDAEGIAERIRSELGK